MIKLYLFYFGVLVRYICTDLSFIFTGWAEKENGPPLPNIVISLSALGPNIKKLIKGHGGSLPLATLKTCYEAEFEVIKV